MGKPRLCNDSRARSQRLAISNSLLKSTWLIPKLCRAESSARSTYRNARKVLTCFRPIFDRLLRASAPTARRDRGGSSPMKQGGATRRWTRPAGRCRGLAVLLSPTRVPDLEPAGQSQSAPLRLAGNGTPDGLLMSLSRITIWHRCWQPALGTVSAVSKDANKNRTIRAAGRSGIAGNPEREDKAEEPRGVPLSVSGDNTEKGTGPSGVVQKH
jgi:hypothetical protein